MTSTCLLDTPLGDVLLRGEGGALTGLAFAGADSPRAPAAARAPAPDPELAPAARQLREYFAGERTSFDLPLRLAGSDFDRLVWAAVAAIGYGETASYGELAARVG